jgi:hypothetical protein
MKNKIDLLKATRDLMLKSEKAELKYIQHYEFIKRRYQYIADQTRRVKVGA